MKLSIKVLAVAALFFTFNVFAFANQAHDKSDPAKRAEKQTSRMVENLNLSEAQAAQVGAINLAFGKRLAQAREANKDNKTEMSAVKKTLMVEKTAELKQVLTPAQFQTFQEMKAKKGKGKKGKKDKTCSKSYGSKA